MNDMRYEDTLVCYKCGGEDVTTLAYVNVNTGLLAEMLYDRSDFYCDACESDTEVMNKAEYMQEKEKENENMNRVE